MGGIYDSVENFSESDISPYYKFLLSSSAEYPYGMWYIEFWKWFKQIGFQLQQMITWHADIEVRLSPIQRREQLGHAFLNECPFPLT